MLVHLSLMFKFDTDVKIWHLIIFEDLRSVNFLVMDFVAIYEGNISFSSIVKSWSLHLLSWACLVKVTTQFFNAC